MSNTALAKPLAELFDRTSEIAVVSYAMESPQTLRGEYVGRLTPSDFHYHDTRQTFAAILTVAASGREPLPFTILPELKPSTPDAELPDFFQLDEWMKSARYAPEAEAHAERMLKFSEARRMVGALESAVRMVHSPDNLNAPLGHITLAIQGQFNQITTHGAGVDEYDADALDMVDDSADQYLVDGVLQDAGLNILMAEGGIGKSIAAMDLAVRVLTTGAALGGAVNRSGAVLYLGADVDARTMKKRMRRLRIGAGCAGEGELPGFLYVRAPLDFSDPAVFQFILHKAQEAAQRHPDGKCALVVVDSLAAYMFNMDENSQGDTGLVMNQLRLISERTGACVKILHHVNKNTFAEGSNRGRGSTVLPNAADCVLQMTRKGTSVILNQTKNRNAQLMAPLLYTITDGEDGSLRTTFLPANAHDVGEIMTDLCENEMARLARESEGEPLKKQELFLALNALGYFSERTKERAWVNLKRAPGFKFPQNGRTVSLLYLKPETQTQP